ncbi:MAG: cupin domain-containing protein [Planctomycetes bacterium]|nr:cupin domain-containing protein [Planctomycetota bacterium]
MQTTLIKKKNDMPSQEFAHCHEGVGSILWTGVLDHQDPGGEILHFIHDDVLPPGTSIGIHQHTDETEYYYIISGNGVMTLDGVEHAVSAGDITAVYPGGSHGLENRSQTDLRIIVIAVKKPGNDASC